MLFPLEGLLLLHASFPGAHRVIFSYEQWREEANRCHWGAFWSIRGAQACFDLHSDGRL